MTIRMKQVEALTWRMVYRPITGRKKLDHHEANDGFGHNGIVFVIRGQGGFITMREWRLSVYASALGRYLDGLPVLIDGVKFFSLAEAKTWAEDFRGDGARISAYSLSASYI